MSIEALKQIVGRALTEPEYKGLLLKNLAQAVEGYELSGNEMEALKALAHSNFEVGATELEERVSRAGIHGGWDIKANKTA